MIDTEREDMNLAAKAAGMALTWARHFGTTLAFVSTDPEGAPTWNPRTDDGDSRRLQCVLKIDLQLTEKRAWAQGGLNDNFNQCSGQYYSDHNDDPCAAAREAVFRVAVEIGRAMK